MGPRLSPTGLVGAGCHTVYGSGLLGLKDYNVVAGRKGTRTAVVQDMALTTAA